MRFSEVWKTSFKAIGKNKRRSFLTMIGLIIGVSAVITVFSIGRAFENLCVQNLLDWINLMAAWLYLYTEKWGFL